MRTKLLASVFAFAMTATPALCNKKPVQDCKVTFGVVYLDRLNNTNNGIPQKNVKDVEKKLSQFGDVCYAGDKKPDLVFFIHTTPAVYHGTHVYTNNSTSAAAVTDAAGNSAAAAASSSSTTAVPYSVDYSVFILDIESSRTVPSKSCALWTRRVSITPCTASGTAKASIPFPMSSWRLHSGCTKTISGISYGKRV